MLLNTKLNFSILLHYFTLTFTLQSQTTEASTFIYAGCSPSKYQQNTPFQSNLNTLLTSVVTSSSQTSYNSFAYGNSSDPSSALAAYGLYQCRNDLDSKDCSSCVQSAVSQLDLVCSQSYSASLQLDGCFVRYSNEDFLGRADTALVYRKCSSSTTSDGEFYKRRDDVLADLQSGVSFRVSSSGSVQGYAQCVGDLGTADCAACLSQAVSQLRNSCASALAAEVYLSQCYARYWASGYYLKSSSDYSGDDIGKTVAIIVGILAGLALVVVFLSFLKKTC